MKRAQKKILVVDDDLAILEAIQVVLEESGYQVATSNGHNVVELGASQNPDLILLDYWLEHENGDVIAKNLRKNKKTENTPVIMISANQDIEKICKDCGADAYLAKPFEIDALIHLVEKYIS